jgi:polysaccharide pyruvyl transferase WcaK-like protein
MGLPTHLVNAVLQSCDEHRDVLQRLTSCTVRDLASSAYLEQLGVPHRVAFDASLEADFLKRPSMDLTGQIVVTDAHGSRPDVVKALRRVRKRLGSAATYYPLNDVNRAEQWRHTVADWRQATAVITARHHGVCLAVMAGVPFVALGSNTWKVEGLLAWLPGGQSVCAPETDLVAACDRARAQPKVFLALQRWSAAMRPLRTFDGLVTRRAA